MMMHEMQKQTKKNTCFTAWNGENTKIHTHFQGAKSVFKTIGALVTPTAINPKTASKVLLSTKQGHRSTTHQGIPTRYFLKPTHTEPQNLLGESLDVWWRDWRLPTCSNLAKKNKKTVLSKSETRSASMHSCMKNTLSGIHGRKCTESY